MLIHRGDDGEHGHFKLGLVERLAGVEPFAIVVAFEGSQELYCGWGEVRCHHSMVAP